LFNLLFGSLFESITLLWSR